MAEMPALSPRPTLPPESALLAMAPAVTPPLRLTLIQDNSSSHNHDSPSWTTMTVLNLLKCGPHRWRELICDLDSTPSTSCLCMLYDYCNCGCSSCIYIWILLLLCCKLLHRLAFCIHRLARRGPWILITGTTSNILDMSHLMDLKRTTVADKDQLPTITFEAWPRSVLMSLAPS